MGFNPVTAAGGSGVGNAIMGPVGAVVGGVGGGASGSMDPRKWGSGLGGMLDKANPKSRFEAQTPEMINQQNFAQAIQQAQGNANMFQNPEMAGGKSFAQQLMDQSRTGMQQQQGYINSLQQQAAGQGPGQALANNMMNQAAQQNAAAATGLMASQKGINPAMAARMAGQQGAMANQQSAQAAANMGLQQQMAAQQQLGGALAGQNQTLAGQLQGIGGLAQQNYGMLQGANTAQNQLGVQASLGSQGLNQATAAGNAGNLAKLEGGIIGGAGAAGAAAATPARIVAAAHGGEIPGEATHNGDDAHNDTVPTMLSPGEIVIPRTAANDREKAIRFLDALKGGESGWTKKKKEKS